MAPAAAFGKTTADFTYKSTGKAAAPGAVAGTGADGTFEDIPFTIAADDSDGTVSIEVHWANQADDFDLTSTRRTRAAASTRSAARRAARPARARRPRSRQQGSDPSRPATT